MTALLLTAIGCQSGPAAGLTAAESMWGNERETLTILADGARFEGLCLEGTLPGKIVIDERGNFSAHGTLRHVGGARREDDAQQEAVFSGTIRGDTMTLTITAANGDELLKSTLKKGARGTAHPCA